MNIYCRHFTLIWVFVVTGLFAAEPAGFFKTYCLRCHNADKQKGKQRLDTLTLPIDATGNAKACLDVYEQLNIQEMPPEDADSQPTGAERSAMINWLGTELAHAGVVYDQHMLDRP